MFLQQLLTDLTTNHPMDDTAFSKLSDDVVLNIFFKLDDDEPRAWSSLACTCTKFSSLVRTVCWKARCVATVPSVVADLVSAAGDGEPPGRWSSLHKLAVVCPGLLRSGVLLRSFDLGLDRELGPDENFPILTAPDRPRPCDSVAGAASGSDASWSLFDDLYFDTIYNSAETEIEKPDLDLDLNLQICKRRKIGLDRDVDLDLCRSTSSHLATGARGLSREQGLKLLASRFRSDGLYVSDYRGCVHAEEKRSYMIFRGIFKDFKRTRVWRTINDGNRTRVGLDCAFCECKKTWDLHSAFCLRRGFGFHDDGEPVVRAYVCENGHVAGAWTEPELYA